MIIYKLVNNSSKMQIINSKIFYLITSRKFRLFVGLLFAFAIFFFNRNSHSFILLLMVTWLTFVISYLMLSWTVILFYHPIEVKNRANEEDSTGYYIFIIILFAAMSSLAGIFILLKGKPDSKIDPFHYQLIIALASVFCSWVLVHTLFTLRYAHLYYSKSKFKKSTIIGTGLNFPGENEPDYLDFAYFSFILGMTFQVSDISITSRKIRHLALLHGCLSFLYNTIILALSINIISGILSIK